MACNLWAVAGMSLLKQRLATFAEPHVRAIHQSQASSTPSIRLPRITLSKELPHMILQDVVMRRQIRDRRVMRCGVQISCSLLKSCSLCDRARGGVQGPDKNPRGGGGGRDRVNRMR